MRTSVAAETISKWRRQVEAKGRQREGVLAEGAASPFPSARRSGGALYAPPAWFG